MSNLDEFFNVEPTGENPNEIFTLEIPEDATLNDITRLALDAYKGQIEAIMLMEPKYRARSLEVAKQYLELAKNAMTDGEELQLKWKKMEGKVEVLTEEAPKRSRNAILIDLNEKRGSGTK